MAWDIGNCDYNQYLAGGFIFFNVHPYLGKIPILTNIFQMGWNHQLEYKWSYNPTCNWWTGPTFWK